MSDKIIADIVTVLTAIVGLAIIAVLVSTKGSDTANVITAGGKAFSSMIGAAVKPVTGTV